jgi:TPR repeat protein
MDDLMGGVIGFIIVALFILIYIYLVTQAGNQYDFDKKREEKEQKERERIREEERKRKLEEERKRKQENIRIQENYIRGLISKAQEGIDHKAIVELARLYFEGEGIEQNYVDAFYWVYKAEVLGNPLAPKLRKKIEKVASDIQKTVAQKRLTEEG